MELSQIFYLTLTIGMILLVGIISFVALQIITTLRLIRTVIRDTQNMTLNIGKIKQEFISSLTNPVALLTGISKIFFGRR